MRKRKPTRTSSAKRKKDGDDRPLRIYGIHAVRAALDNPARRLHRLHATQNGARDMAAAIDARQVPLVLQPPDKLAALLPADAVHQGVILETDPLPAPDLAEIAATGAPLVVLDQITDPRNVGAIVRAAAVFGAGGVLTTTRNAPTASGAMAKAASGALERVPLVEVANLARALKSLADAGYLVVGLAEDGTESIGDITPTQPIACVMGAEDKGLRRLTRENCGALARLPATSDGFATLNVATAAAVALYALTRPDSR